MTCGVAGDTSSVSQSRWREKPCKSLRVSDPSAGMLGLVRPRLDDGVTVARIAVTNPGGRVADTVAAGHGPGKKATRVIQGAAAQDGLDFL